MRDLRSIYRLRKDYGNSASRPLVVLLGALGWGGCATGPAATPATAPSSDVRRIDAWQDAEKIVASGEGRSAAVGRGESMAPLFGDTTMLVLTALPFEQLEPGMMAAYRNSRGVQVVHRLVERTKRGEWRVQGINNAQEDWDHVTPSNYLGVVYASLAHEPKKPAPAQR